MKKENNYCFYIGKIFGEKITFISDCILELSYNIFGVFFIEFISGCCAGSMEQEEYDLLNF